MLREEWDTYSDTNIGYAISYPRSVTVKRLPAGSGDDVAGGISIAFRESFVRNGGAVEE